MKEILSTKSAAALSTILIVGAVVAETALAALLTSFLVSQQGAGLKNAQEAVAVARTGLDDALLRIVRDTEFAPSPNPYSVAVGQREAEVLVCRELTANVSSQTCTTPVLSSHYEIVSIASVAGKTQRIKGVVIFDSVGLVRVESISEL